MSSPTFANAVLSQDGLSVQVTFNQVGANAAMLPASGVTGLTILNGSTPVTISSSARVSNFAYKFALSGAQAAGSVLTLACTPGNLTDSASNAVASFSGQAAQYSIPELIAPNVLYALGQITTANGYTVTASPSRPLTAKEPASKTDLVIDIMEPTTREIPVLGMKSKWEKTFKLVCYRVVASTDALGISARANEIIAAVRKGLAVDRQRGFFPGTQNPLAYDTVFPDADAGTAVGTGQEAVEYSITVPFQTTLDDLYNQ